MERIGEDMEERCDLCFRLRVEGGRLCRYHQLAYDKLKEAFNTWKEALGIDWRGFLEEVLKLPELGEWAREVAENLLKEA